MARPTIDVCMFPAAGRTNRFVQIYADALAAAMPELRIADYRYGGSLLRRCDIFHVHWPDATIDNVRLPHHAIKVALFTLFCLLCRLRGTRIVWTVHNLAAHDGRARWSEWVLWTVFLRCVDTAIHLCEASIAPLRAAAPGIRRHVVIPHPHYRGAYPAPRDRAAVRAEYGLDPEAVVFCNVGLIRPYKGLEELVAAFREADLPRAGLAIAGKPMFPALADTLRETAAGDARIALKLAGLSDQELVDIVAASDVVVLPYHRLLNSGVAILALSLDRRLLAPDMGMARDLAADVGPDWVALFAPPFAPARLAEAAARPVPAGRPDLSRLEPAAIGAATAGLYREILAHG